MAANFKRLLPSSVLLLASLAAMPKAAAQSDASRATDAKTIEVIIDAQPVQVPIVKGSARIRIDGVEYTIQAQPEGAPSSLSGSAGSTSQSNGGGVEAAASEPWIDWTSPSLWLLVAVSAALAAYFLIVEPYRRRRLLVEALRIIDTSSTGQLTRAEQLLDQALLAGLRKKDIALARFALAFVRAQLGKLEPAATVLADLEASQRVPDRETVYLSMWVHWRLDKHEKVEKLYQAHARLLGDLLDVRLIASIAYLKLARLAWARKDVDGAMHYFEQVRKLGVLTDQIPEHLENHAVVLGIMSLFEKRVDEATARFQGAVEAARQAGKSPLHGELGLLLCQWRKEEVPNIDAPLGAIVAGLAPAEEDPPQFAGAECPHCGKPYRAHVRAKGSQLRCTGCRQRFAALVDAEEKQSASSAEPGGNARGNLLLSDEDLLLRNVRMWHAVSLLFVWRAKAPRSGLTDAELDDFLQRLARVSLVDEGYGDPHLLAGLILYYFGDSDRREAGRQRLEQAVACEVHVPEVMQILECENKLAALRKNSLTYFHQLAAEYVSNPEVRAEYRSEFKRRMERFRRFRELGELEVRDLSADVAPSLQDLQNRGQILRNRVANIVTHKLDDAEQETRESLHTLLGNLTDKTKDLATRAKELEQTEYDLMAIAGQITFSDDDEPEQPAGETDGKEA